MFLKTIITCTFLTLFLLSPLSMAQENSQKLAVEDVVGFVQYIDGDIELKEPGARKARLDFKRLLYVTDSFLIQKGDLIKVATTEGCTVVFYGPIEVNAPKVRGGYWATKDGVQRWVCPEGRRQTVESKGEKIELFRGELFLNNNDLMFFEGSGKIGKRVAIADVLHKHDKTWTASTDNYDLRDLKEEWDDNYPVPSEVVRTEVIGNRVDDYKLRFGLGVQFGYGFAELSDTDSEFSLDHATSGIRFWSSYNFDSFSIYGSFSDFKFSDSENPLEGTWDDEYENFGFKGELLAIGMRMPLAQRLVFLTSLGYGTGEVDIDIRGNESGGGEYYYYSRDEYSLYQISVGVQKEYFDSNWFLIWSSISIDLMYGTYSTSFEKSEGTSRDDEHPDIYGVIVNFGIGPGFQF
jgi:hypothetical protein